MAEGNESPLANVNTDILGAWLLQALTGKKNNPNTDGHSHELADPAVPGVFKTDPKSATVDHPLYECTHEIRIVWDIWAKATIQCVHGEFVGVSDGFDLTEALVRAVGRFNEVLHSEDV